MKRFFILPLLLLWSEAAISTGVAGAVTILGAGTTTCGAYVKHFTDDPSEHSWEESWLAGFFSAFSISTPRVHNVVEGTDLAARELWIKNYCSKNPLNYLVDAANALIKEVAQKRASPSLAPNS
ncbi:MAG: hypothetical protein ABJB01_02805 [Rudaea sp.]